jgi:hypothetical protein
MNGPNSILDLPKLESRLLGVMAAIAVVLFIALIFNVFMSTGRIWGDFIRMWIVADMPPQEAGSLPYDAERFTDLTNEKFSSRIEAYPWPYPPHFWLLIRPLSYMPFTVAHLVWQIGGVVLLMMTIRLVFRFSWSAVAFVGFCPAVLICLYFSQTGVIAAAFMIGGVGLLHRHPVLAGVAFAFLTFKPTLGVLVPLALLAGRHWIAFAAASIATAGLIGLSVFFLGAEAWLIYLTNLPSNHIALHAEITSFIRLFIPTVFRALSVLGVESALALLLQYGFGAIVAVCVVWVFAFRENRSLQAATLLSASVLIPPYLHVYDAAVVTMAAMLLLFEVLKDGGRPGERSAILLAWFMPILVVFTNAVELPVAPVFMFVPFLFIYLRALREQRFAGRHYGKAATGSA